MKVLIVIGLLGSLLMPAFAIGQTDIYADPQNLEILPADISPAELSSLMKSFAIGLGVRCQTCHVGEEGQPLSTFDFAADDREMKAKARSMIQMVNAINNDHIDSSVAIAAPDRVRVRCVTCHRGVQVPKMTGEVLDDTLMADGLDAALGRYDELREEYYGTHSYDFGEYVLPFYAEELANKRKLDEAIEFLKLNTQHFPGSAYTYFSLGKFSEMTGDTTAAIEHYSRAAELEPDMAGFLRQKIDALASD
jgi:tetratricopeptide (TPR) repeat protein